MSTYVYTIEHKLTREPRSGTLYARTLADAEHEARTIARLTGPAWRLVECGLAL